MKSHPFSGRIGSIVLTRGEMTMTKADALRIQAEQCAYYEPHHPGITELVRQSTTADTLPDGAHPVSVINRHIPRGCDLEWLMDGSTTPERIRARAA